MLIHSDLAALLMLAFVAAAIIAIYSDNRYPRSVSSRSRKTRAVDRMNVAVRGLLFMSAVGDCTAKWPQNTKADIRSGVSVMSMLPVGPMQRW